MSLTENNPFTPFHPTQPTEATQIFSSAFPPNPSLTIPYHTIFRRQVPENSVLLIANSGTLLSLIP
jgi:hypothetical protein